MLDFGTSTKVSNRVIMTEPDVLLYMYRRVGMGGRGESGGITPFPPQSVDPPFPTYSVEPPLN